MADSTSFIIHSQCKTSIPNLFACSKSEFAGQQIVKDITSFASYNVLCFFYSSVDS